MTVARLSVPAIGGLLAAMAGSFWCWWSVRRKRGLSELILWRMSQSRIRVRELRLYPVKSCKAVSVKSALVTARGFFGDRTFQVSQNGKHCTPRDPGMASLFHLSSSLTTDKLTLSLPRKYAAPTFQVDLLASTTSVRVTCEGLSAAPRPDDDRETLQDYGDQVASWLEHHLSISGARLVGIGSGEHYQRTMIVNPKHKAQLPKEKAPVSLADEAPFLLVSMASLNDLNQRLKTKSLPAVTMERFRPNIVIAGGALEPWAEERWKRVRIGRVEFWVWQSCARCEMVTIDNQTLKRNKEPLAALAAYRKRPHGAINFGMHLIPCSGTQLNESEAMSVSRGEELVVLEM